MTQASFVRLPSSADVTSAPRWLYTPTVGEILYLTVLGIEPRPLYMLWKCYSTEMPLSLNLVLVALKMADSVVLLG